MTKESKGTEEIRNVVRERYGLAVQQLVGGEGAAGADTS